MTLTAKIDEALSLLAESKHAIALTGAGISTPSGIPDYRSADSGMWENADPFQVASIIGFRRRPQDFYEWIHPLAKKTLAAQPNVAHLALANLEKSGPLRGIITQNIDMLHTKAGSCTVYEVHGHMRQMTCMRCYHVFDSGPFLDAFLETQTVPHCTDCQGVLKPNVILYGEQLPVRVMEQAKRQARHCDLMIVAGSSLEVAPVNELPMQAVSHGAKLIVVNFEETYVDRYADVVLHADVVDILPKFAGAFL